MPACLPDRLQHLPEPLPRHGPAGEGKASPDEEVIKVDFKKKKP